MQHARGTLKKIFTQNVCAKAGEEGPLLAAAGAGGRRRRRCGEYPGSQLHRWNANGGRARRRLAQSVAVHESAIPCGTESTRWAKGAEYFVCGRTARYSSDYIITRTAHHGFRERQIG